MSMCKHKQKFESSSSITIIAAGCPRPPSPPPPQNATPNTNNTSVDSNADEKPSKKYAISWWKLKLADRKAHNDLMKIHILSPFLFCKVYQTQEWLFYAKKVGLLNQERMENLGKLSDDDLHTTDLMEDTLTKLQERIVEYSNKYNKATHAYLEEIFDDIKSVEDVLEEESPPSPLAEAVIKKLNDKHWFKYIRRQLSSSKIETQDEKHNYVVFLVAWQVCFYIKSVYDTKPLEIYNLESQLDTKLEVCKQQGNEFFKNEQYTKAIETYTTILCQKPYLYIIYGNRAACYLKKKEYRLALSDGRRAVALSPNYEKGHYRYAQALFELGKYKETLNVLSKAMSICSSASLLQLQKEANKCMANKDKVKPNEIVTKDSGKKAKMPREDDKEDLKYANMPELETDNSDLEGMSGGSDQEPSSVGSKENHGSKQPAKKQKKKKRKKTKSQSQASAIASKGNIDKNEMKGVMKLGTTFLLDSKAESAVHEFRKVFLMIKSEPDILPMKELAILHYSLGWAYHESGVYCMEESLHEFQEIIRKWPEMNFPLSYYGKGLVYRRQNQFRDCIQAFEDALHMCDLPGCIMNLCWPGVETTINISIPENFRLEIKQILNISYNPPRPDATCRFDDCTNRTRNVYFSDFDFKGFLRMICTENCFVEYHSCCWKKYKVQRNYHLDKDFLNLACVTPDCFGLVCALQIYDNTKQIPVKEITLKDLNSSKKERQRQKDLNEHGLKICRKKKASPQGSSKSEDDHVPVEEKLKQKPPGKVNSKEALSKTSEPKKPAGKKLSRERIDSSADDCDVDSEDCIDIGGYNMVNPKETMEKICHTFEKLLEEKGSFNLADDDAADYFVSKLDDESKVLILQVGSLVELLKSNPKFVFSRDRSTVYLSSAMGDEEKENDSENDCCICCHSSIQDETDLQNNNEPKNSKETENCCTKKPQDELMDSKEDSSSPSKSKEKKSEKLTSNNEKIEEIDCTKANEGLRRNCKTERSDIIILSDSKKTEVTKTAERSVSPDKQKGKAGNKTSNPIPPPGEKCDLKTYLEEKIKSEKNDKSKYCCPMSTNNCDIAAEIEKLCEDENGKTRVRVMKVITLENNANKDSDSDEETNRAVANALEMINEQKKKNNSSNSESLCVGEVGIQCDQINAKKLENDKDKLKKINEDLIKRYKELQDSNEKLSKDFENYKEKHEMIIINKNAENKAHKSALEKLKKEVMQTKNLSDEEISKLKCDHVKKFENLRAECMKKVETLKVEQVKNVETLKLEHTKKVQMLSKRIDGLEKEKSLQMSAKMKAAIIEKEDEVKNLTKTCESLHAQIKKLMDEMELEKQNHEEIVKGLTTSITEQSSKTQKVQIAFLEVKKEILAVKYQQQAAVVQNTINQMQYWPLVPEVQKIRSIWDDYKKEFQKCYEKMLDEFKTITDRVKKGEPLEELPPAQYAEPPPFPKTPMPSNVPINSPCFGPSSSHSIPSQASPTEHNKQVPLSIKPDQKECISQPSLTTKEDSAHACSIATSLDSEDSVSPQKSPVASASSNLAKSSLPVRAETKTLSFASSVKQGFGTDQRTYSASCNLKSAPKNVPLSDIGCSESEDHDDKKKKMFDRIIIRLGSIFPSLSREELRGYVADYRRMQPQGSLSGMKFDDLIISLEKMIRSAKVSFKTVHNKASPKKLDTFPSVEESVKSSNRVRANQMPAKQESSWCGSGSVSSSTDESFGQEEPCVICFQDMARDNISKLHCGHVFHKHCISCWLNEQRTCPICRVHALLPEEYPSLG